MNALGHHPVPDYALVVNCDGSYQICQIVKPTADNFIRVRRQSPFNSLRRQRSKKIRNALLIVFRKKPYGDCSASLSCYCPQQVDALEP